MTNILFLSFEFFNFEYVRQISTHLANAGLKLNRCPSSTARIWKYHLISNVKY